MDLTQAQTLAQTALVAHGITDWRVEWDNAKRRNGLTDYNRKVISLSAPLTNIRTVDEVRQTIGHEIAHVLVGPGHGHGPVWQRKMRELGLRVERCSVNSDETMQKIAQSRKYTLHCPETDSLVGSRERKGKRVYVCLCHRQPVVWKG